MVEDRRLRQLLSTQAGVVARFQLVALGVDPHDVRRLLRRRDLVRVSAGVYLDHTGPPTWLQSAWSGVLAVWPAALCHDSALRADDGPSRGKDPLVRRIHVAVARTRTLQAPPGVVLHHLADLDSKVRWNASPPRVRPEHAVLDLAAEARDELDAIAVIADAVQARRTTASRVGLALDSRTRIARRRFLQGVLADVESGTCSVLEHGYLVNVERPHGLPVGRRQVKDSARGALYRDVEYTDWGLIVELDGRLFHADARSHDGDLDRDLDAAVDGRDTVRLGWGQAYRRACSTAARIGLLLEQRGWSDSASLCQQCRDEGWPPLGATG